MSESSIPPRHPLDFVPVPELAEQAFDFAPAPEPGDDPYDFAPVPTAPRRDGWSADRQHAFIAALRSHGGVAAAARMVGMTPQSANRLRKRPGGAGFARAWDAALDEGRLRSWDAAMKRIHDGYRAPIIRNGEVIGYRHRRDDRLMFAALRHIAPARFGPG